MEDAEQWRRRQRAATLEGDAAQALHVAERLELLADEVEGRLEPITTEMTPGTWAGQAADEARRLAYAAADDLATAARDLRVVAGEVRTEATAWQARAVLLRACTQAAPRVGGPQVPA
jgi:hypothetical protein